MHHEKVSLEVEALDRADHQPLLVRPQGGGLPDRQKYTAKEERGAAQGFPLWPGLDDHQICQALAAHHLVIDAYQVPRVQLVERRSSLNAGEDRRGRRDP